jgi:tetratricopeptide (TPR) repeat protein
MKPFAGFAGLGIAAMSLLAPAAFADTLRLKDGRLCDFPKIERAEGGYKIPFKNGDVFVPAAMVTEAVLLTPEGDCIPANDEEKAKVEKGLQPFDGKWIPKAQRDRLLKERTEKARERMEDLKKHREWRNRYMTQSAHFKFEYTIAPDIFETYRDFLEAYFTIFAKKFKIGMPAKGDGRLKVCFYHDADYYYQVSGAPRGAIGYFRFVEPIELNFFYDQGDVAETQDVLFHECNHYLVHLINPRFVYPHWLAEGMAEYYGASSWDPAKKELKTGLLQEGRIVVLMDAIAGGEWQKLEEMIRMQDFGGLQYAWAWSLVHMLMENPKVAPAFQAFFVHLALGKGVKRVDYGNGMQTVEPDEAIALFKATLKIKDLADLQSEWFDYVKKLEVKSGRGYALAGNWAMQVDLKHRAIRYFKTSLEKGEIKASTYDKLGELLMDKDMAEEGIEAFRKSIELDPLTARTYMHLANALAERKGPENAKEADRLIRLAVELDPEDPYLKLHARYKKGKGD